MLSLIVITLYNQFSLIRYQSIHLIHKPTLIPILDKLIICFHCHVNTVWQSLTHIESLHISDVGSSDKNFKKINFDFKILKLYNRAISFYVHWVKYKIKIISKFKIFTIIGKSFTSILYFTIIVKLYYVVLKI